MIQLWTMMIILGLTTAQEMKHFSPGLCGQSWTLTYVHDTSGWDIEGSLRTLHKHVEGAYLCKVQFSTPEFTILLPVEEFHVRGPHICVSSSWVLSDNGTHFGHEPEWLPIVVCTSGEAHQANYSATSWSRDINSQPLTVTGVMKWFTKQTSCMSHPVYSHFFDGTDIRGSLDKLLKSAKTSAVKIMMRDRGYSMFAQNTKVYGDKLVTAQSLNHLSLLHSQTGLKHNDNPFYLWHAAWTSKGRRDVSRWRLNVTVPNGHFNDFVALDWFGDDCWRSVFSTDGNGLALHGSMKELLLMIRLGHEVRVHVNGYTLKATSLQIVDGSVVALTAEEFARRGSYPRDDAPFFNTNTRIVYRLIHSSGKMKTYKFTIEDYVLTEFVHHAVAVDWLVDTRPWIKIHETTSIDLTPNDPQKLTEAILNGASIRVSLETNSHPGQVFLQTDSVQTHFVTNKIVAQSIKNVVTEIFPKGKELFIPIKVSQQSFLIDANGSVTTHTKRLATRVTQSEDLSTSFNISWFSNF